MTAGAEVDDDPGVVDEDEATVLVEVVLLLDVDEETGAADAVESNVLGAGVA